MNSSGAWTAPAASVAGKARYQADMAATAQPSAASDVRRLRLIDRPLLATVTALLLLGLVTVFSASTPLAIDDYQDATAFLKRQLIWLVIGAIAGLVASGIDYRIWQRWSVVGLMGSVGLLLLMLPFGQVSNGSQRWAVESMGGGSIQPSELAKLAVIVYLADWLSGKREEIRDLTLGLIPFSLIIGLVCGLIVLEKHLSTAVLIAVVASWMFFTAGAHLGQMLAVGSLAGAVAALLVAIEPYRMRRITGFLDPLAHRYGAGYQIDLSIRSFVNGSISGQGLGRGALKQRLPAAHTDAIFAVIGEELGLLGALLVLALFTFLVWRGLKIAAGAPDRFSCLLATGITCWIASQALLNMAVATGSIPPTGISLPLISYGGSNLVTTMLGIGILMSVSRRTDLSQSRFYAHLDFRRGQRRARLSRAYRERRIGP
jgi:cell division protein FtsW